MRLLSTWGAAAFIAATAMAGDEKERVFQFKKDDAGKVPAGWKAEKTGKGEGSVWKVVADESSPSKTGYVLAQTAESPSAVFNLCLVEDSKYKNVELSVSFKTMKGEIDQGGGLVWRYKDANNYYVARMNPLEENFRVYKVVDGKRVQLGSKAELPVPAGEWHSIEIQHVGDHIVCAIDGRKHLDVKDSTFTEVGKIGLWSKADAQSHFDNLKAKESGDGGK